MIEIKENTLDLNTYLSLRASVHWKLLTQEQAKKALLNSLYTITAINQGESVGMGRIVGDGAVICYIQDFIVKSEYQGQGIGKLMMEKLIQHVESFRTENSEIMLCLMCAKGREKFYEKFGFVGRPTDSLGPGMIQYLK
ncbi:MAG: GNAT family N-acetyltransferase [Lachnospiraceae bacterium]|jgi:Acetyltransferases|nr:GNAT family N-acetyltransferase [Lachnospiraceae bacterium]MCI8825990.1 GNAT family N-acetyltransferase [Lachnospiraceae bacterium]MCI9370567.1 GNAT family N-acetyltransferase [Lachnospiraceae bacterium]